MTIFGSYPNLNLVAIPDWLKILAAAVFLTAIIYFVKKKVKKSTRESKLFQVGLGCVFVILAAAVLNPSAFGIAIAASVIVIVFHYFLQKRGGKKWNGISHLR